MLVFSLSLSLSRIIDILRLFPIMILSENRIFSDELCHRVHTKSIYYTIMKKSINIIIELEIA